MDSLTPGARSNESPNYYYTLLRGLFDAIGGAAGRFEQFSKEMLPPLPETLKTLNKHVAATPPNDERERDMIVELCLTAPVRLTRLVPHLRYRMQPLLDDQESSSDMVLSSSPGQDLPDDAPEPRCLPILEELAGFVAEPTEELAMLDVVVPVAAAFDELLTRITTGLASWTQLSIAFAGQVKGKDLQGMRTAAKAMSRGPAGNMRHAHYDVAHAYEFPVSPRSPLCTRIGGYLGALHRTVHDHGPDSGTITPTDRVADDGDISSESRPARPRAKEILQAADVKKRATRERDGWNGVPIMSAAHRATRASRFSLEPLSRTSRRFQPPAHGIRNCN
ncbi:hypothetical protein EXIGLDRAFT_775812 [Exidia glandulosa HHB12029]|uniref:Uncharacterized protein n=1 Tax=Exidia glandulosa HHB12029 TaxID=1314781 RepID=A0A165DR64_EXIGL|nr:hypothetical protein EXIGLDRAFT_775812 [Exidia glandulosa HHB12029]